MELFVVVVIFADFVTTVLKLLKCACYCDVKILHGDWGTSVQVMQATAMDLVRHMN
jgi:hypothetical protein